ncbi:MAG: LLM class flavin-dependent oxidoreductase [Streptomyces sp.]|uniref:LLM class flavin-dependent oxidoreductase n=1 Tax=Streptomyces sp. TaxID=1931 RepID=UPI003D6A5FC7
MRSAPEYGLVLCSQFTPDDDTVARFAEQVEQVRFARDAGFSSVWATQHYLADPFQYLHPLAVLSRIVPESGDMRIGTAITLMALGNPVDLAEELATLDIISGGRLTVGAGLGYRDVEFDAFRVPRQRRLRRFLDNLDVVRRLWTEDEVTFSSDVVELAGVRPVLRPVQRPHPPLWLAGHTDRALRRTARMGLPWIAAAAHVDRDYLHQQVATYRAACAEYGHGEARIQVLQEIYVGDSDESAVEDVRAAMTVKYEAYRAWGQDQVLPASQSFDKEFDELRRGRFILGSAATCRARLADLIEHVNPENILLRPQWPGMPQEKVMAGLKRLTDEVLR